MGKITLLPYADASVSVDSALLMPPHPVLTQCVVVPYPEHVATVFAPLASMPWSFFLDSGVTASPQGRYSMLVTAPRRRLWQEAGQLWIADGDSPARRSALSLWEALRESVTRLPDAASLPAELPFVGGALGYLAYDFGLAGQGISPPLTQSLLEAAFGIYDTVLLVDHHAREAWLCAPEDRMVQALAEWQPRLACETACSPDPPFQVQGPVRPLWSRGDYATAFGRVQDYIQAGDCYQVNLAQPFAVPYAGSPWSLYQRLRAVNPAPFSAYLSLPQGEVLSFSPERLLRVQQDRLQVRPIKGTRPRLEAPQEDQQIAQALLVSPKDRAENVMIVDLLRNDLGRVAATGSVQVPQLCALESYAHVHHLVSVVEAHLAPGRDALSALEACFPGGSITGAPKRRAMEIIAELEAGARGLYCGSIGYLDQRGGLDMNIAIRSMTAVQGDLRFWAGGGIVADSDLDAEYQETLDKVAVFHRELAAWAG
ncbi:aminodeoxychorismate synthase component I [Acidithiobacillus ferrivorans]|uniref:aminodeoxychorismate synthase n=1 Tax=Acidithiobacillus ferrivorans TaxID=160808 RepID=A0A7T4WGI1_9PROT|nr:aminodeoxychorismate synthase component I [Acidithiobacillus ferrivorans]